MSATVGVSVVVAAFALSVLLGLGFLGFVLLLLLARHGITKHYAARA